jgi:hypothetical protein
MEVGFKNLKNCYQRKKFAINLIFLKTTLILPKSLLKLIISKCLSFFIDNVFVMFVGHVFQQTVEIFMGTNCGPLLADLFHYSYEADFIQGLLQKNEKKLT